MKNPRASNIVRMVCALFLFFFASFAFAGEYVVQKGDSLSSIAKVNKVEGGWVGLWKFNKVRIKNPNLIFPSQKLLFPVTMPIASRKEEQAAPIQSQSSPKQKEELKVKLINEPAAAPNIFERIDIVVAPKLHASRLTQSIKEVTQDEFAIPALVTVPAYVPRDVAPGRAVQSIESDKPSNGEQSLPHAQAPPENKSATIETSSSTTKVGIESAVKTDAKKADSASLHPPLPATTSVVDDFNDHNVWDVVQTPPQVQGTPNQSVAAPVMLTVQLPAPAVKVVTALKPPKKREGDDDFDNPNVWDSRAIDMNGRMVDTSVKTNLQPSVQTAVVQSLQAQ